MPIFQREKMSKFILITEEEQKDDYKVQTKGKAKIYYSFKSAYKAFRKAIVSKIATGVPYFAFISDGKRIKTNYVFECLDDEESGNTEELKQAAEKSIDVVYNTVTDEKYVFTDNLDLKYNDSEIHCLCDKDGTRFSACGLDYYDIVSNSHFPPDKNKQYYFYYEWYGEEYSNCSFTLRLLKAE